MKKSGTPILPAPLSGYSYWVHQNYWTAGEAALLLLGTNPDQVSSRLNQRPQQPLDEDQNRLRKLLVRAFRTGLEKDPSSILSWAVDLKIQAPLELINTLSSQKKTKSLYERNNELRKENRKLIKRLKDKEDIENLNPNSIRSLYRILLGMAVAKYKFKLGQRSRAALEISRDVWEAGEKLGDNSLKIDEDTVRNWLNRAVTKLEYGGLDAEPNSTSAGDSTKTELG